MFTSASQCGHTFVAAAPTRCTRSDGDRAMLRARASQGHSSGRSSRAFWRGKCSCQSFRGSQRQWGQPDRLSSSQADAPRTVNTPVIVMKCWAWYSADGDIGHRRVAGPLREELGPTCDPHDVAWPRAHHRAASANCIGSRQHAASAVVPCQHRRVDQSPSDARFLLHRCRHLPSAGRVSTR